MVSISLFAIYQTRKQRPRQSASEFSRIRSSMRSLTHVYAAQEEIRVGDTDVEDVGASSNPSTDSRHKREMSECRSKDVEDAGECWPQAGELTRTNTDLTLVDENGKDRDWH